MFIPDEDDSLGVNRRASQAISERVDRVSELTANLEATTLDLLATQLGETHSSLQVLRDAVYEESPYGRFCLTDEVLQERIAGLDSDISEVRSGMANLNLEVLQQRDSHRDRFIEQWSI